MKIYMGYDEREADGFHVFVNSVIRRASKPVSIIPLSAMGMPQGSNAFTMSRFLVPWLTGYQGHAIFCDASDMLMLADVSELDALFDSRYAVQVVKHPDYKTKNRTKYRGTDMECPNTDYSRKNWASIFIANCEHPKWKQLTPEYIEGAKYLDLLQFKWLEDSEIGELPDCWNRIWDEGHDVVGSKIGHFTAGIPSIPAYAGTNGSGLWRSEWRSIANCR